MNGPQLKIKNGLNQVRGLRQRNIYLFKTKPQQVYNYCRGFHYER
jgi:hypothetical protein